MAAMDIACGSRKRMRILRSSRLPGKELIFASRRRLALLEHPPFGHIGQAKVDDA